MKLYESDETLKNDIATLRMYTENDFTIHRKPNLAKRINAETVNVSYVKSLMGMKTSWEINYKPTKEKDIIHEICHVMDSIGTYKQESLKKKNSKIYMTSTKKNSK